LRGGLDAYGQLAATLVKTDYGTSVEPGHVEWCGGHVHPQCFESCCGPAAGNAQQDDIAACIGELHLRPEDVHTEFLEHRRLDIGRELEEIVVIFPPNQEVGEETAFRAAKAAALGTIPA
jgi:hypothetical protein